MPFFFFCKGGVGVEFYSVVLWMFNSSSLGWSGSDLEPFLKGKILCCWGFQNI